jgi:hypothetical protein
MYCVRDPEGNPTGRGIDAWTEFVNHMISMLEVAIVSKPVWWNLEEIYDEDLLNKVFEEVMEFENSFRRPARTAGGSGDGDGGSGEDSTKEHPQADSGGNAPKMVDREVLASLDA